MNKLSKNSQAKHLHLFFIKSSTILKAKKIYYIKLIIYILFKKKRLLLIDSLFNFSNISINKFLQD